MKRADSKHSSDEARHSSPFFSYLSKVTLLSYWKALVTITVMVVVGLSAVSHAKPSKKHRGPCEIAYPSDMTVEWECRTLRPGESLEKLFGERWIDVARFNRIDRRHAHSGLPIIWIIFLSVIRGGIAKPFLISRGL